MTVVIQRVYFKLTHGKRIFRMTPIHHAFADARLERSQERQYRIILSADTASEVRQMPSQKRR